MKLYAAMAVASAMLVACSSTPAPAPTPIASTVATAVPDTAVTVEPDQPIAATSPATNAPVASTPVPAITIYSPYSSEGLLALNEFRSNNPALNDFLLRNRKPDYFFSGINTDFSYQKIYLVYLGSENLYLFDSKLSEPYKKFHPLPATIKENFKDLKPTAPAAAQLSSSTATAPQGSSHQQSGSSEIDNSPAIEKTLSRQMPTPYLSAASLYQIPRQGTEGSTLYPELYYFDVPLDAMLENQYSARYDNKKQVLKVIFPRFYDADMLYKTPDSDTRKIPVDTGNARQISLLVPDFMPGSLFYRSTHNNISKIFSSLYQVNVPENFIDSSQLYMRYAIKLCQSDKLSYCAVKRDEATYVRAIVIEATLYDKRSKTPIDTFVLK